MVGSGSHCGGAGRPVSIEVAAIERLKEQLESTESMVRTHLAARLGAETENVRLRASVDEAQARIIQLERQLRETEKAGADIREKNVALLDRVRALGG